MKLLIAAGGTGGHIFPGLAVAEAFIAGPGREVCFVGTPYGLEERLIPPAGYRLLKVEARPFTGRSPLAKARTLIAVLQGILQARRLIRAEKPQAILGMGGFTAVPVILAGLMCRVPCFIHEQNVLPGMANKLLAPRVKAAFVSFAETGRHLRAREVIHTGMPIRKAMAAARAEKEAGSPFGLFVFGGSRGARRINDAVIDLLPFLEGRGPMALFHQTGTEDFTRVSAAYNGSGTIHEVFPFTDHMDRYYNLADLVVSRAGASTVFEVAYFGKPAIFVPYPYAAGAHQWKNASYAEKIGGARVIEDKELSGERLFRTLSGLREDPGELARMGADMATIYVEDGAGRVIRGIEAGVS